MELPRRIPRRCFFVGGRSLQWNPQQNWLPCFLAKMDSQYMDIFAVPVYTDVTRHKVAEMAEDPFRRWRSGLACPCQKISFFFDQGL
jgi:hypothetical protein